MNTPDATRSIGVFDSGVGGLTVLKALHTAMPRENLVYLGDTARLPYGTKSPASIARYACQAAALLQQRDIKLLVVACNTASAVALEALREQMQPLPVIGVVDPGAAAAVAARPGGRHLVLATEATVRLSAYREAILGLDAGATVDELACEMLVALAEEGWNNGAIGEAIVRRYLDELHKREVDEHETAIELLQREHEPVCNQQREDDIRYSRLADGPAAVSLLVHPVPGFS